MIRKYATLETLSSSFATKSLRRSAHKADFSKIAVRPGYLYVRSRAISSRTNDNYDTFPAEEIKKGYLSFIGKPVFVNHENENHRRARGVILDAQLHEDRNIDNSPDTWVEVLMEVDAIRFPKLAEAIVKGHIERTSMGVDVEMSECGVCHNEARTPMEYCAHIPRMKGSKIRQVTASGTQQDVLVHEVCYGLAFFENSLLVEEPADPTAYFLGVDTSGLEMQATKRAIATRKRAAQTEWCDKCQATVDVHKVKGATVCDNCDTSLYDASGNDVTATRQPRAFGGRRVSTLTKTAKRKTAFNTKPKSKCLKCNDYIFLEDSPGRAYGWFLLEADDNNDYSNKYFLCNDGALHDPMPAQFAGKRHHAYGEVVAPPAVDTLRQENCPICGADEYGGDQCLVCGFTKPPEMYMDPDLGAAGLNDLREEQGLAGAAMDNPNGMSGDMTPGLDTNNPVVENVLAGDVQPLECDSCGSAFDYSPEMAQQPAGQVVEVPATSADNEQPAENPANSGPIAPGSADGDVPPTPNAQTDDEPGTQEAEPEPPAGESLPKSETDSNDETHDDPSAQDDAEADVPQDPSNNDDEDPSTNGDDINSKSDSDAAISDTTDVFDDLQPGDPCPDCNGGTLGHPTEDNPLNATDENPDPDGDGDDDRLGSENDPNHAEEEQEVYDEEEDEDEKSKSGPSDKSKKSNKEVRSRRTTVRRRSQKEDSMARPLVQAVAEQQKIIKRQASEIASLKKAVGRIERLAGIRSTADAANPAQPIPQPGGGAAYPGSSLEEARTPGARGNVSDIGGVAETTNVGAYTTDSVDNIGMSSPSGYDITQDVTTPVAGTETMRPIDEVRTRPVIEFGNPLKPDFAFPLEGDFAQRATVDSSARIYASLRLARLRIEAGTNESSDDEIAEGEAIANDETKSNDDIKNEIETLSKVMRSAARKAPKTASRNLVPQARGGRKVPSVAKAGGISTVASASAGSSDDPFLFI